MQSRFLTDWLGRSSANPSIWWIPVSYTDSSKVRAEASTMPRLWMNDTGASLENLPDKDSWLLLNINATGNIFSDYIFLFQFHVHISYHKTQNTA